MAATKASKQKKPSGLPTAPKKRRMRKRLLAGELFVQALDVAHDEALEWLRKMHRIRVLEDQLASLSAAGKLPGIVLSSVGQEAVAVGACSALRDDDYITSTHRPHGHFIARGGELGSLVAELFGKANGCCGGKGGSFHVTDLAHGNLGATGVVGGNLPIAAGAALACQMNKAGQVALAFSGDGATHAGAFHESLNLAAAWNLPLIFLCENNQYALSYSARHLSRGGRIYTRAQSYGIEGVACNGMQLLEVRDTVATACKKARGGGGPTLIEANTYMLSARDEDHDVRPKEEWEKWKLQDPIEQFRLTLEEARAITPEEAAALEKEIKAEVAEAIKQAMNAPAPAAGEALTHVYKGWTSDAKQAGLQRKK